MKFRTMTAVSALVLMTSLPAHAQGSGPRYVPRPNISVSQYSDANRMEDRSDRRLYNEYEHRESCQHYRRIPRNSLELFNCMVVKAPSAPAARVVSQQTTTETRTGLLPIIHSETIYFDFDHSNMRADQEAMLDKVIREIDTYNPADITVTGYADRSGSVVYNEKLSQRRAHSVSEALRKRSVANEQIDQQARGETDNAVPTADGVKNAENRRVVIDFRR